MFGCLGATYALTSVLWGRIADTKVKYIPNFNYTDIILNTRDKDSAHFRREEKEWKTIAICSGWKIHNKSTKLIRILETVLLYWTVRDVPEGLAQAVVEAAHDGVQ